MAVSANIKTGQSTWVPTRKVSVGALAGAISVLVIYVLNTYVLTNKPLGPEVGSAFTTVLTFIMSWIVPPSADETSV